MTYQFVANDPSNFHIKQPAQDPSLQDILGEVTAVAPAVNTAPVASAPTQAKEDKKDDMKEMMDLVKEMKEELQKLRHHLNNA